MESTSYHWMKSDKRKWAEMEKKVSGRGGGAEISWQSDL